MPMQPISGSSVSAYKVVEDFEAALCAYTGARYAVTTNSCSMAIQLAVAWHFRPENKPERKYFQRMVSVPKRTYCSVPMAIIHAGARPCFHARKWSGAYSLDPIPVWDSARRFTSGMYPLFGETFRHIDDRFINEGGTGQFVCVSFQTSKILGLEQGGAILHDNAEADTWLRRARFDGRLNAEEKLPQQIGFHCYMNPSTAALGLQKLAILPSDNPDQAGAADFADLSELPCFR